MFIRRLSIVGLLVWLMAVSGIVAAQPTVTVESGNIYYLADGKAKIQLTKSGKDSSPTLSPDGKVVVFTRRSTEKAYLAVGMEEDYSPEGLFADQLWIIDVDGKNERMLVKDRYPNEASGADITKELENTIAHIEGICFSPDSKTVYFISSAWVTSGALHCVNIDGARERFITGANSVEVVPRGEYKGDLIIGQHRYFVAGGSYDWLWLFTPEGKELGPLGEDLNKDQRDFLYSDRIKE